MKTIFDETGAPISMFGLAKGFPNLPVENLVERESFLETVKRMFSDVQIVFLEGDEGAGATTTAAQFCTMFPENCFALFIKPASKFTYSPDYLRIVLAEQLSWYLDGKEFADDSIHPSAFRTFLFRLRRKASKKNTIYFVIDGLQKILNSGSIIEEIFNEVLPLGFDDIKFLICGKESLFKKYIPEVTSKYIQQLKFSSKETQIFLKPLILTDDEVRTVYALCDGVPGKLASVRRLLMADTSLQEILDSSPAKFPTFIKLEFSPVENLPPQKRALLACITFSNRQLTVPEINAIASATESDLEEVLAACNFLTKLPNKRIEFVSDAHRRFASTLLQSNRTEAIGAHISHLAANPTSSESLNFLPIYYQQIDEAAELVKLLTSEHFTQLLGMTSSLGALRTRAKIGGRAAFATQQVNEVLGFSLMQSVFLGVAKSESSNSEIRALVSLGEHQTALSIAYHCITNEERLMFLATYAKKCKEVTQTVDKDVLSAIQAAAKAIDFSQMGESAIEVAAEIVHVDQDLAMSIVDIALKGSTSHDRDLAMVRLSIESSATESNKEPERTTVSQNSISDEKLRAYVSSIIALVSDYTYKDVISACAKLEQGRQLAFVGYWIDQHKDAECAVEVVEYALNLMITNSTYSPKMREFNAIAAALPYVKDRQRLRSLILRFDSQRGLIQDTAISVDTVSLLMTLAHAEMEIDIELASTRIIDCYFDLSGSENLDTKIEGFALMLRSLTTIDQTDALETVHGFRRLLRDDFFALLTKILENSADHFLIAKAAIRSFAEFDFFAAVEIAKRLNTVDRRDKAFVEICRSLHTGVPDSIRFENFIVGLRNISDEFLRDATLENLLNNLAIRKVKVELQLIEAMEKTLLSMEHRYLQLRSVIWLAKIRVFSKIEINQDLCDYVSENVPLLEACFQKAELFFELSDAIAKCDIERAKGYYTRGMQERDSAPIPATSFAQIMIYSLTLCNRAIGSAIAGNVYSEDMCERVVALAELLPSLSAKVDVLSDLAVRAWLGGSTDVARRIMGTYVLPVLDAAYSLDKGSGRYLSTHAVSALYCSHPQIAIAKIKLLQSSDREAAIVLALDLLLTKCAKSDPDISDSKEDFLLNYDEALHALTLIEFIEEDWNFYLFTKRFSVAIAHKKNAKNFTVQQRNEIADRLQVIARRVLPDLKNITHDGYVILSDAAILLLRASMVPAQWEHLIVKAELISNLADKGFVLCEMAAMLPGKMSARKSELRNEALRAFNEVPSIIDKINRLITLSDGLSGDGLIVAKQSLRSAIVMTLQTNNEEVARDSRRKIIDIAHRISSDFAEELSDLIDTDAARRYARSEVKQRLKMLEVKQKLSDVKEPGMIPKSDIIHLPEAAWKNLMGLISGRLEIKSPLILMEYLQESSGFELKDSYPLLSWFVENNGRKYRASKDPSSNIVNMVSKLLLVSELSANVMMAICAKRSDFGRISAADISRPRLLGINNRVEAIQYIVEWLADCDDEILLCDPYFGIKDNDLEFLQLVLRACPAAEVTILTSKETLSAQKADSEEHFTRRWKEISDQAPPSTRIIAIGVAEDKKLLIHDRWLVCGNRGLKLGTSFNGIGTGKLSGISILTDSELIMTQVQLRRFVAGERQIEGVKIGYASFTI
jgi:hypothetical protein